MNRSILTFGIIFLFAVSVINPMVFGYDIETKEQSTYLLEDYYGCYSLDEIPESIRPIISDDIENEDVPRIENVVNSKSSTEPFNGPMDSPWPMYCHDVRHTGRSPYSTIDTSNVEKWRFKQDETDYVRGSPIIGDDETIYFGGSGDFYALCPNGTLKWKYGPLKGYVWSTPAIDENGVIYFGLALAWPYDFYALNPDGTLKWKYSTASVWSSPAIGDDGTIYFGDSGNHRIKALYPNGTLRWAYKTGNVVYSSPAIGNDGTIYCGSHDTYLYALYPNNGTLKWRYKTGHWIRTSPCIADDGTIYIVSLDNHLYALYPNGTLKWKTNMGQGGTSPTIGQDGIIYCGYTQLHAIYPNNGSVKWKLNLGSSRTIQGATPCHSSEGTIYFGTHISDYGGGEIIAVNSDGIEQWREIIADQYVDSAPAIGSDGTVYVGSAWDDIGPAQGYLHAFNKLDPNAPSAPTITGQTIGKIGTEYEYTFKSTSSLGRDVYYYVEWGDGTFEDWFGPFSSGEEATANHTWSKKGTYTIKARAKDTDNLWGPWGELEVNMPRDKKTYNTLFLRLLERYPLLNRLLILFMN